MGYHYVKPVLMMDSEVDLTTPEILMYASAGEGLRLIGVEYFVGVGGPDAPVPNPAPPAPILFGRSFDGPMAGHIPGMPRTMICMSGSGSRILKVSSWIGIRG